MCATSTMIRRKVKNFMACLSDWLELSPYLCCVFRTEKTHRGDFRCCRTTNEELPSRQEYDTVCLFADVSGFTALSEAMMGNGGEGVEGLAKHLNSYFGQMVRIIASEGGDVFKVRDRKRERGVQTSFPPGVVARGTLHFRCACSTSCACHGASMVSCYKLAPLGRETVGTIPGSRRMHLDFFENYVFDLCA